MTSIPVDIELCRRKRNRCAWGLGKKCSLLSSLLLACVAMVALSSACLAQIDPLAPPRVGGDHQTVGQQPAHYRWRVGVKITGANARGKDVFVALPVPTDWPEQRVVLVEQTVSPQFQDFAFRAIDPGSTQVVARTPTLNANQQLELILTFAVEVSPITVPQDTSSLTVPPRPTKEIKAYLENTSEISYRNNKLADVIRQVVDREQPAWEQVKVISNWIRENIETRTQPPADTLSCFQNGGGAPEDVVGLFVAMCRSIKVPARMVWVEGTQYAEFYLLDSEKNGHWYPCHILGLAEFGTMPEPRVILQKGDSIKMPERELPQRYVAEFARVKGTSRPTIEFIQELLPAQNQ